MEEGYNKKWNQIANKPSKEISQKDWKGQYPETPVFPDTNKLNNIYLHLHKDGKDVFYPINVNDERWKSMLKLYSPTDTNQRGYMISRRNNILNENKVYSSYMAKKFGIFKKKLPSIKPIGDKENILKTATSTIEEMRTNYTDKTNKNSRETVDKIKMLRGLTQAEAAPHKSSPMTISNILMHQNDRDTL